MNPLVIALFALAVVSCGRDGAGDRGASNAIPATRADEAAHFEHALSALGASSPPVVQHDVIYTPAVECDGHRCCDPTCPLVARYAGQACFDSVTHVGHVALTDERSCASMFVKLDAVACASVRCQTTGCLGPFEEAFRSDCARTD